MDNILNWGVDRATEWCEASKVIFHRNCVASSTERGPVESFDQVLATPFQSRLLVAKYHRGQPVSVLKVDNRTNDALTVRRKVEMVHDMTLRGGGRQPSHGACNVLHDL